MCGVFVRGAFGLGLEAYMGRKVSEEEKAGREQLVDPTAWRTCKIKGREAQNHTNHTKVIPSHLCSVVNCIFVHLCC